VSNGLTICNCRALLLAPGIQVKDGEGKIVGTSQIAGKKAIYQTVMTRVALPAPGLLDF